MIVRQLFAFFKKIKLGLEVNTGIFYLYSVLLRREEKVLFLNLKVTTLSPCHITDSQG